ncbi:MULTISPECIES: methionine ABC transporter permease [Aeribacillus]|jgi:D-methionine transport system permease protein|uniref:Methionine ABC transporter ATP-binding protein n=2 Tax=Aeribacillus TaxID=1055323 RepID=A0A165XH74_9BACI|nr:MULTISPECIES: methionine ABC transporter permease [Aeribacillus]KZM54093.1 methionine ABC transporter ATP-binding protein [Aeribacillus pallidus]KZN96025.1 methionine ABC transporter ATP-binding protein [Aeribacillus pallidus]MDR9795075.1 methionine ABC transporter permease [Aeribacillus pallidus]MED0650998.1 ABC transporter permease [Aeribacillus composti]MED1442959.1 ABC transporter permease [Aeribacillus composti]
MFENIIQQIPDIIEATKQTAIMVGISVTAGILFGIPLGTILFLTRKGQLLEQPHIFNILNSLVNLINAFPLLILIVAVIPFTRLLVGTSVGTVPASVPLSIAIIPYFARLIEQSLVEVNKGVIEAAISMGANIFQIIWKVMFVEARAGMVVSLSNIIILLISYSTIAGVVGAGGLGDFAVRNGYYRYQPDIMLATVVIMIILVSIIQISGSRLASFLDKR